MPERNKDITQEGVSGRVHIDNGSSQQSATSTEELSTSRRQFTKAGLLATPVLMSVVSRPVLGLGNVNCLSNALSGNLSNPDRGLCSLGQPPSFWKPSDCTKAAATPQFNSIAIFSLAYPNETRSLEQILCSTASQDEELKVLSAAYLNAFNSGPGDYPLTVAQLGHLVNDTGSFTAFLSHYGGLKGYLESTW